MKQCTVVIDGVFFQFNQTGIARVWRSLLEEWANTEFGDNLLVLDRSNTAPKVSGITYKQIQPYDYRYSALDCTILQGVCDQMGADIFISSYYTTPLSTPTVFMAYDMVPEVMQFDLNELCWQEKHRGILYSSRYLAISENTAKDLTHFFPQISPELVTVAYCGVNASFTPPSTEEVAKFKRQYNFNKPYFLLVGSRLSLKGYKNAILLFKAISQLDNRQEMAIVCIGGEPQLETELANLSQDIEVHLLTLEDAELRLAYGGAIALVYPSKYEGFGLPIVEAMACGCPVITCHNSSIPEVAGKAALYVEENNVEQAIEVLQLIQKPEIRHQLIELGLEQAKQFSWEKMADIIADILQKTAFEYRNKPPSRSTLIWQAFRQEQSYRQQETTLAEKVNQLTQQNQDLLKLIDDLEEKNASLSTTKSAIRQLARTFLNRLGSSRLM
ncbi:glycosyl transferase group 1 [Rippkaea orientalis PCC 8801]|uniref:Glycosyl transferase group 1 n=1 Tax=Rippkaea orientalis (strain PCC 8801 / RF-1) TaxID=41431 RepID=B7JW83_RIPO1|nr:glycosyltransferase [Rippkaea orientalis]ACK66928.1 glycosyl transferase group 1 [Rippkaea orientalis PCC 8801]